MDIRNLVGAYREVLEGLTAKQKKLDVDKDGDIGGDDLAALRSKKAKNEEKVECPKCEGEGCDHCDGKGYHMDEASCDDKKMRKEETEVTEGELPPALKKAMQKKEEEEDDDDDDDDEDDDDEDDDDDDDDMEEKKVKKETKKMKKESVDMQSMNGKTWREILLSVYEGKEKHTKGATEPEAHDSKESGSAKEFAAQHNSGGDDSHPIADYDDKGHDDASKAGRATKPAPARSGADKLSNGDKKVVK